jgi:hypothetical protein
MLSGCYSLIDLRSESCVMGFQWHFERDDRPVRGVRSKCKPRAGCRRQWGCSVPARSWGETDAPPVSGRQDVVRTAASLCPSGGQWPETEHKADGIRARGKAGVQSCRQNVWVREIQLSEVETWGKLEVIGERGSRAVVVVVMLTRSQTWTAAARRETIKETITGGRSERGRGE